MSNHTPGPPVKIKRGKLPRLKKFSANPATVKLRVDEGESLSIRAPSYSALWVYFFKGEDLTDYLQDPVPDRLKGEYAPFGKDRVRISSGKEEPIGSPQKGWPTGEDNPYPYLIYVEKKGRLAHGNSPPEIILS